MQVRDDGGLEQDGKMWFNTGCILKVEVKELLIGWMLGMRKNIQA